MLFGNKNNANDHIAIYLLVRRKTESSQAVSQGKLQYRDRMQQIYGVFGSEKVHSFL